MKRNLKVVEIFLTTDLKYYYGHEASLHYPNICSLTALHDTIYSPRQSSGRRCRNILLIVPGLLDPVKLGFFVFPFHHITPTESLVRISRLYICKIPFQNISKIPTVGNCTNGNIIPSLAYATYLHSNYVEFA